MTKRKRSDPTGPQYKSLVFDTKSVAEEPDDDGFVYVEAYASIFDNVDSHNDVIVKGAYAETLKAWDAKGAPIPSFYNHGAFSGDPLDNVGFLVVAREDNKGLFVRVGLDVGHNAKAAYVHRLIKQERLRELSVGYIARKWELIHEDGKREWEYTRKLTQLDLFEVSFVSVASNDLATVTSKAAALLYGAGLDDDDGDDETGSGEDLAAKALDKDQAAALAVTLTSVATALAAVATDLDAAIATIGDDEESDDSDDSDDTEVDDADKDKDSGSKAGVKSLSTHARVVLAMAKALHGAETE